VLESIFKEGVLLVATSNIPPENLYKNGLQRERFLPAIALLQQHQQIFNLDGGVDYRLRALERAEIYHFPLDQSANESLEKSFIALAPEPGVIGQSIEIEGRPIETVRWADGVLWCEFDALCDGPRSQNDYIELARIFGAILVGGVPQFAGKNDDQARRFINLVDEFYDRNVKLIISAAFDIDELYIKGQLDFEFKRTKSRLLEMQSHEYLERPHLP
jgi:cell division protein ZapE